jgi:hypothetical protein
MNKLREILQTYKDDIIRIFAIKSTQININDNFIEEFKSLSDDKIKKIEALFKHKSLSEKKIEIHKNLIRSDTDIYKESYKVLNVDKNIVFMTYSKQYFPKETFPNLKTYDSEYILKQTIYSNKDSNINFISEKDSAYIEIKNSLEISNLEIDSIENVINIIY